MTETDGRPGADDHRGDDADHRLADANHILSQLRRRRGATWAQRHRYRVNQIFSAADQRTEDYWSASELRAFELAAAHLRNLGLFGRWQVPESARQAWRCQRCPCNRDAS